MLAFFQHPKPPFNYIPQLGMNVVEFLLPLQLLHIYAPKVVDVIPCVSVGGHVTCHLLVTRVRQVVPAYKQWKQREIKLQIVLGDSIQPSAVLANWTQVCFNASTTRKQIGYVNSKASRTWWGMWERSVVLTVFQHRHVMTCPRLLGPHVCETAIHIHDGTNINCCFAFPIVEISLCFTVNLNLSNLSLPTYTWPLQLL